ncbi:coiled-coil domain-containing protein 180 isoform X2 [Clupea harengus]|uniref:Coiled-coil domain-containing protein 180 isoform X2 n=1 Tax=Clupea harengus TaxID=7950 RepID=A0A6P8GQ31_CLUHA|nr:coiled-coil domain-containing protein 180 isoform X2 [Clupea harengus]
MAETRVLPSGEVYRQMFDAQVQLSLALHDGRSKRAASGGFQLSCDCHGGQEAHPGGLRTRVQTECSVWSEDTTARAQLFSGGLAVQKNHQLMQEISGLPDTVEAELKGSDIIERLKEKKRRDHTEAVVQLHRDLAVISTKYESCLRQQAENTMCQLAQYDATVESLMRKIDSVSDLESFSIQDHLQVWELVSQESANRRECIRKLDENLDKYISERTAVISTLLRKYTQILKKFSYILPCDVHRLMDSEAMMINQAVLSNRRAVAKLTLNLMEDDLQKEALHRLRWEDKLKDWKRIKVLAAVNRFKDFINGPALNDSKDIRDTLDTLHRSQARYNTERITVLQAIKTMTPPNCSQSLITVWYSNLSAVNDKIDCVHIDTMKRLQCYYEQIWQNCLDKVECFKDEVHTYGLPVEEIQDVVDTELLSLVGKCQKQVEEHLEVLDRAFECLAKRAAGLSKLLFKFLRSASLLWEVHTAGLQRREQQLQGQVEELLQSYKQEQLKKDTQLDILLDKLRQESSEDFMKVTLDKIFGILGDLKQGYMTLHKEEIDTVEIYPALVLEELQIYSMAVSRFFGVKEVHCQVSEECKTLYPSLQIDVSGKVIIKKRKQNQVQGRKRLLSAGGSVSPKDGNSVPSPEEDNDCPEVFFDSQNQDSFTSAKGNSYNAMKFVDLSTEDDQEPDIPEVELVRYPAGLFIELLGNVRLAFFDHLEEWYNSVLMNSFDITSAKKVEREAEHALRLHLHQPRARRIEMDIYYVRAAELVFHRDHVDKHCKAVLQSLANYRSEFQDLQVQHHKLTSDFRGLIYGMEDMFNLATKSDVLVNLSSTLQSDLEKHNSAIQASQRQFREKLEQQLEDLRGANAQLLKSIRLFSEGGNFSPKETELYQKRLEKIAKRIDSTEEGVHLDMEQTEYKCLEQAKDVISRFEEKFFYLTVDLKFLEKIQGILTNSQVYIKTEVTNSNTQKKKLSNLLDELEVMAQSCSNPSPDKTVTLEEVLTFTTTLMGDLRKRCFYLDCILDPSLAAQLLDCPLQGPFAVAARPQSHKEEKSIMLEGLLNPSSAGISFIDDVSVGVVKGLLRLSKPKVLPDNQSESLDRASTVVPAGGPSPAAQRWSNIGLENLRRRSQESIGAQSVKRFSKPNRCDRRFQVFGSRPVEQSMTSFKGIVTNILWKANDGLLQVAEEFYRKKERRAITRPQYLQETFEQCAEEMNKRLLQYRSQAQDYHNCCLQELRMQLKDCEDKLSTLPVKLISHLTHQCLHSLSKDMELERQKLAVTLKKSEEIKRELRSQLSVRLGHPACAGDLERLQREEEHRQTEQSTAINSTTLQLKHCLKSHGETFVSTLAAVVESLLFQMDNLLTVDDVHGGQGGQKKDNVTPAGATAEEDDCAMHRGRQMWPGLLYFESPDGVSMEQSNRQTTSVTTAKTTLVHLQAIQARDAAYQSYLQRYEEDLAQVEAERSAQMAKLINWQEHWMEQLTILARFNSE